MKFYYLFFSFMILCIPSFGQEWKRVETSMYSFEIPADWISVHGNGSRISEVKSKNYRQYSRFWYSPEGKHPDTWAKAISLDIDSYESLYSPPLTFQFIQDQSIAAPTKIFNVEKEDLGEGKMKIIVYEEDKEISIGKIKRYNAYRYMFLLHTKDIAHVLTVRLREGFLKERPENHKLIERIFNSFVLK